MTFFANIQALRGLAALGIVFTHLFLFGNAKYGLGLPALDVIARALMFGVDIFFVISGFIMMATTEKSVGKADALSFMLRRVGRIYPIYWFICFLLLPVIFLYPTWINSGSSEPTSLLHSFLLLPDKGAPLIMVAWTLEYELFFYAVFALCIWLFPREKRLFVLSMWAVLSAVAGWLLQPESPILDVVTNGLLLEFLLGCILYQFCTRLQLNRVILLALIAAAIINLSQAYLYDIERILRFMFPAGVCVLIALNLELQYKKIAPRILQYMGDISYALYLVHVLVLSACGRLWLALGLAQYLSVWVLLGIMLVGSIVAAIVLHHFIEKPLLRAWHAHVAPKRSVVLSA